MDNSTGSESSLFEFLPVPCVYFKLNGQIDQINAAARRLIVSPDHPLADGVSIYDTHFITGYLDHVSVLQKATSQLHESFKRKFPQSQEIKQESHGYSQRVSNAQNNHAQRSSKRTKHENQEFQYNILLPVKKTSHLQWQLTILQLAGNLCFSLTASQKPLWKDAYLPQEEEFDFLLTLAEPSFKNVPYYVNAMHADSKTLQVNKAAAQYQPRLANAFSKSLPLGLWNDTFTRPLTLTDGTGPTSLRERKGMVSALRGIEDPETGMRSIHDCTTTVLQNPFTADTLGVLVQIREAKEYSDWLQQSDILQSREIAEAEGRLPIMVRTILNDGSIDYFSNSWERFTSSSRGDLLRTWSSFIHPEDVAALKQKTSSSMSTGLSCEYQVRLRNGNSWHYFKERFAPVKQDGKILRWYCISTDIKDLVSERDAALQATERLYRIINSMNIIIFEVDDSWTVTQAEGALKVLTSEGQEMVAANYPGNSLYDICSIIRPDGIKELMDELLKIMDENEGKVVVDYKIGKQWLRTIAIPGVDQNLNAGKKLFGITLDRSAEHDSENSKLQLETIKETTRLKSQFLANISHELRTPISGLIGILELLRATKLDGTQADYVSILESSSQSLLTIVNDVLDLSKAEAGHISINTLPFSFYELLNDLCRSNEVLAANKGLGFISTHSDLPPMLLGDPGRIRQVLQNLLGNAIKFTSHGSITIHSQCALRDDSAFIQVDILDTGIGIDPETMATLFKPFVQADQSDTRIYGGTGLGLSIARRFAQLMNGDVVLQSEKGTGTRAVIQLKLDIVNSGIPVHAQVGNVGEFGHEAEISVQNRHVLVVEDNKINEKVIRFQLQKLKVGTVSIANNGAEAVDFVKSSLANGQVGSTVPDLILMDCQMPVLDGYKATRILRNEVGYSRPIIALTASAIQGDKEKCMAAGMDDHMAKPVSQQALRQVFRQWLAK